MSRASAEAIGAPLEAARVRLLDLLGRLSGLLGEHAAPLLEAARRQLEQRSCRIAVIGQIKAGKSTFINALAKRPGLLPTDINPWTVVVTALHFRNAPTPPEHAAVFHLFSVDEWKRAGRRRRAAQGADRASRAGLPVGPPARAARGHAQARRARLGPRFAELLGKCHRFETVTPEVLTDYVSAGDETSQPCASGKRRHYSDITRSADLYFNDSPFAFPDHADRYAGHQRPVPGARRDHAPQPGEPRHLRVRGLRAAAAVGRRHRHAAAAERPAQGPHRRLHQSRRSAARSERATPRRSRRPSRSACAWSSRRCRYPSSAAAPGWATCACRPRRAISRPCASLRACANARSQALQRTHAPVRRPRRRALARRPGHAHELAAWPRSRPPSPG